MTTNSGDSRPQSGRRLASVFDGLRPGTPASLGDLETLMRADTERRILAVLDRVLSEPREPHKDQPRATTAPT